MLRTVALLALVAAASATFYQPKCPLVPGKYPFDMDKFQGDWYLAAGNEKARESKGKCHKVTFPTYNKEEKKEEQVLASRFTGVSNKDNMPFAYEMFLQPMISDKIGNLYGAFRKEGTSMFSSVYKTSIINTDYTNYAVMLSCKSVFDAETKKFNRSLYAEIYARENVSLSKDTMDALINQLASYDVDAASIKPVEMKC